MRNAFRRLSLRLRLGLSAAVAVTVAVSAVAIASWLVTKQQLAHQLDSNLRNVQASPGYVQELLSLCGAELHGPEQRNETPTPYVVQVITSDGTACVAPGNKKLEIRATDIAVARGLLGSAIHDTVSEGGQSMRVSTTRPTMPARLSGGYAVSIAQPLDVVDKPLNNLALALLGFAGVGVVGAATAGVAISRGGLKPVEHLTRVAELIARTQDLTVRIPVDGGDEIARLSRSFNDMTEALAASRESQQQLIADAGHELRTPLTSLRANIQLLAKSYRSGRKLPEGALDDLLDSVESQTGELAVLIADLQELSRSDAQQGRATYAVVPLHEVARRALERVRPRGNEVRFTSDLDEWYVIADAAALERAIVNLLDNAVKFSPPEAVVSLRLGNGRLTVRDQGPGIAADELPHVFDRFWRSPTSRSLPGSGLGLAIVAKAVQEAGGTVTLRAAETQGTEAVVQIPGARTPPPTTAARGPREGQL
ncbi:two-component sensor histidine kinase [Streptomyces spiralis]|uniref:histidine kinase n=1 Tax=Streptomyces spiralis TaxID=66376 RepID=A0A919A5Z3_9ACTN|nr:HAMP domain-containing sensor histidine kinase [Streptomyces spiralis]GHE85479.1 two-component sensor histidine kinase [Streptomyces spiralis]